LDVAMLKIAVVLLQRCGKDVKRC